MLERAKALADSITQSKEIHIVTHIDADGIAAGAVALQSLQRQGKECSIEFIKQLDELVLERLQNENYELVWFTDLGSSISKNTPALKKIITDHHICPNGADAPFHLNPHLFNRDGAYDISGAGTAYLVAQSLDKKNVDLSSLAIVGACGDLQDRKFCKLHGTNRDILADGKKAGVLHYKTDLRYFGKETRPLHKLLQYASDPLLPGLTGREDACMSFLNTLHIRIKDGDLWRRWIDLTNSERQQITSGITHLLLTKGFGHRLTTRLIGETYTLPQEKSGTELHDAKEFATLLNSTARYGQHDVGLHVCLGNRDEWLKKARNLLRGHRHNLVEGIQFAKEEGIEKRQYVQFFHAGTGIRDTIVGIIANMLLNEEETSNSLPLIGFAETETGEIKASARGTQLLIDKGLNLSVAMKKAAKAVGGVGGGHNIAAGATLPKGKEEEFLNLLEKEIQSQFSC